MPTTNAKPVTFDGVRFGYRYRDIVSGVYGVATGKAEYQFKAPTVRLEWQAGNRPQYAWFPVAQLALLPDQPIIAANPTVK